jgi:hypothetical protein
MVSDEFLADNQDIEVSVGDEDTSAGRDSPGGIDAPTLADSDDPGGTRGGGGAGGIGRREPRRTSTTIDDVLGGPRETISASVDGQDISQAQRDLTRGSGDTIGGGQSAEPVSIAGSGPVASIDIPGTDTDVGGVLDRGARGFEQRVTQPLGEAARRTNEQNTPFTAGSEGRGQLAEDFIESAAGAANVPAGLAAGVRIADETSIQFEPAFPGGPLVPTGDPQRTEQTATAAREAGEAGVEFAAENPGRATAIAAGGLAGGLGAGAAARGARVGVRGARSIDLPDAPTSGGRTRGGLDDFLDDTRGQADGSFRRATDEDQITIGGDDIAGRSDLPERRIEAPDPDRPTQRPETTGFDEGDFNTGSRGRRSDVPDRFDRGETAAEANPSFDARARFDPDTDTGGATVPRDPLDTSGGRMPAGGVSLGDISLGGLATGQTLARQGVGGAAEATPGLDETGLGFDEIGAGTTGDGTGDVTVDDILVGPGDDSDTGTRGRGLTDTAQTTGIMQMFRQQTAMRSGQSTVETPGFGDPTQGTPQRPPSRPPTRPTRGPPRGRTFPDLEEADEDSLSLDEDAVEALLDSGIASGEERAEDIFGDITFRL